MYQMPSQTLVQRMHTLVSNLQRTDPERQDETCLLMMEASSIMAELDKEYAKPVDKFADWTMFDKQVVVYAKSWYKETDSIEDLKKVMAKECLVDTKFIKDCDVLMHVALVVHKVWKHRPADNADMDILYKDPWEDVFWNKKTSITTKDQLDALLQVLRHKDISYFPRLPAPSADYLPLGDDDTLERWAKNDENYEETLSKLTSGKLF